MSFSNVLKHRPSFIDRWKSQAADEEANVPASPKPAIPSALQPPPEVYSTPLPLLSMVVLSIVSAVPFVCFFCALMIVVDYARRVPISECVRAVFVVYGRE